jgi:hypothetical protein
MRRIVLSLTLLVLPCAPVVSSAQGQVKSDRASEQAKAREQLAYSLGVLAYIYAFPLVRMEQIRQQSLSMTGTAVNTLRHRRTLATPKDRTVVSPNNDTAYSSAWLDLTRGPLILHTPDARGRYCSYAFYDAYTNNFKVISKRNTRDAEADYAITGPQWKGTLPEGVSRIEAPTNSVWLLVRTLIADESDWPGVVALQEKMALLPMSAWGRELASVRTPTDTPTKRSLTYNDALEFFGHVNVLMLRNPPPASDAALVKQFAPINLSMKGSSAIPQWDEATLQGLMRSLPVAQQIVTSMNGQETLQRVNGWLLGTKGGSFGDEYLFRAIIAERGIGQLVPEEASYLVTDVTGDGQPLNGANSYVLRFPKGQLPPAHEFWSLTLYGADFFFIDNPANRYSLGDRTRGLKYEADGGLTIYLQQTAPTGNEANWLPTPAGDFNLNLRAYLPRPELLNNSYQPPAVQRVK